MIDDAAIRQTSCHVAYIDMPRGPLIKNKIHIHMEKSINTLRTISDLSAPPLISTLTMLTVMSVISFKRMGQLCYGNQVANMLLNMNLHYSRKQLATASCTTRVLFSNCSDS